MENSEQPAYPKFDDKEIGLTKRELMATNAQAALISNADTLREITKSVADLDKHQRDAAFFKIIAGIAVLHADALLKELSNQNNPAK